MVHTLPDYTTKYKMTTIFGKIDDAELAARLGSIDSFDRRGNVVWMEDFEAPIHDWQHTDVGAESDMRLVANHHYTGGQCMELEIDNAVDDSVDMYRCLRKPVYGRLGFEIAYLPDWQNNDLEIDHDVDNSIIQYNPKIYYDDSASTWKYWDRLGVYQDLTPTVKIEDYWEMWHNIKLVIDVSTGKYVRLIVDDTTFDLSGYAMEQVATNGYDSMFIHYKVIQKVAVANSIAHLDNFIATQNEI